VFDVLTTAEVVNQHALADADLGSELVETEVEGAGGDEGRQAAVEERIEMFFVRQHGLDCECTTWYKNMYHVVHSNTEGVAMKMQDTALLLFLGLAIWVLGTIYYAQVGPKILETTAARYWSSFFLSPVLSAAMCVLILLWRQIPAAEWASAMLLLAIPGMVGEAVVLTHMGTFMPKLHEATGGKYGAYLFATYGFVLGVAEVVTLRAGAH